VKLRPRKPAAPPRRAGGPPSDAEWADAARALARARIEVKAAIAGASAPERNAWRDEGPALLRVDAACAEIDWLARREGMTP